MPAEATTLYHVHDPMCSWCWGFRSTWDQLRAHLGPEIAIVNVVGGLAPDTDEPMPMEQQHTIAGYWKDVAARTGAEFNFDFWQLCQPRRSTYPACRAVLAARIQGSELAMIDAIQRAYYLRAMNPSDHDTLVALAVELKLDQSRFADELESPLIENLLQQEFNLRRRLGAYSFPSLVLETGGELHPIQIDYRDYRPILVAINSFDRADRS
jgi:putative protein-disulfide isomerase